MDPSRSNKQEQPTSQHHQQRSQPPHAQKLLTTREDNLVLSNNHNNNTRMYQQQQQQQQLGYQQQQQDSTIHGNVINVNNNNNYNIGRGMATTTAATATSTTTLPMTGVNATTATSAVIGANSSSSSSNSGGSKIDRYFYQLFGTNTAPSASSPVETIDLTQSSPSSSSSSGSATSLSFPTTTTSTPPAISSSLFRQAPTMTSEELALISGISFPPSCMQIPQSTLQTQDSIVYGPAFAPNNTTTPAASTSSSSFPTSGIPVIPQETSSIQNTNNNNNKITNEELLALFPILREQPSLLDSITQRRQQQRQQQKQLQQQQQQQQPSTYSSSSIQQASYVPPPSRLSPTITHVGGQQTQQQTLRQSPSQQPLFLLQQQQLQYIHQPQQQQQQQQQIKPISQQQFHLQQPRETREVTIRERRDASPSIPYSTVPPLPPTSPLLLPSGTTDRPMPSPSYSAMQSVSPPPASITPKSDVSVAAAAKVTSNEDIQKQIADLEQEVELMSRQNAHLQLELDIYEDIDHLSESFDTLGETEDFGFIVSDSKDNFLSVNAHTTQMLEIDRNQLLDLHWSDVLMLPPSVHQYLWRQLQQQKQQDTLSQKPPIPWEQLCTEWKDSVPAADSTTNTIPSTKTTRSIVMTFDNLILRKLKSNETVVCKRVVKRYTFDYGTSPNSSTSGGSQLVLSDCLFCTTKLFFS